MFYSESENFQFLTMSKVKKGYILPRRKNGTANFWHIFALEPKLELDAETIVLHSGPKFLCFVVQFYKYFWFWYQTEIVSKKVYAAFWLVLEITSLK